MPPDVTFATFIFPGERAMPVLLKPLFSGRVNRAVQGVPIRYARSSPYQSAGRDRYWQVVDGTDRDIPGITFLPRPASEIVAIMRPGMMTVTRIGFGQAG